MFSKSMMAAALAIGIAGPAAADNYNFHLHNRANGWVINGFYTYQDGRWSKNWLTVQVRPGRSAPMLWNSQGGDCRVPFRVSWVDWGTQNFTMDWCRNKPTNLYMKDEGFTFD